MPLNIPPYIMCVHTHTLQEQQMLLMALTFAHGLLCRPWAWPLPSECSAESECLLFGLPERLSSSFRTSTLTESDSLAGLEALLWFYYKTQCLKNEQTFGSSEMNSFNIFHKLMDDASVDFPDLTFRITRSHQTNLDSKQSDGQNVFVTTCFYEAIRRSKRVGMTVALHHRLCP